MDLLLPIPARLSTFSRASVCTISPANPFNFNSLTYRRVRTRVNPVRVVTNSNFNSRDSNNCEVNCEDDDIEEGDGLKNVWEETEFVEVFGIGSRKDALLEFCLASPSLSPDLRFWNILVKDSEKVLLQEKVPIEASLLGGADEMVGFEWVMPRTVKENMFSWASRRQEEMLGIFFPMPRDPYAALNFLIPFKMSQALRLSNYYVPARIVEVPSAINSCSKAVILDGVPLFSAKAVMSRGQESGNAYNATLCLGSDPFLQRNVDGFYLKRPQVFVAKEMQKSVASAAYGTDHVPALDIIRKLKSTNGLAIGIILKPFSFEGQRRYDENTSHLTSVQESEHFIALSGEAKRGWHVTDLIDRLQKHATICIDLLTLDEALKTSYNAVLMAVNAISILMSEDHIKLLDATDCATKELSGPELIKNGKKEEKNEEKEKKIHERRRNRKQIELDLIGEQKKKLVDVEILESYKEAKTGFGAGYNVETSILRAVYDCPFLGLGVKGSNGVVICIIASSGVVSSSDVRSILRTFRQTTGCNGDIVISIVQEANMEPNLIVTTIVTCGNRYGAPNYHQVYLDGKRDNTQLPTNLLPQYVTSISSYLRSCPRLLGKLEDVTYHLYPYFFRLPLPLNSTSQPVILPH
ncbi:hypothetical protein H5410_000456 [Solanum commersonii]|uniref:Uncharacterized protein n=1 Tax=Solanum commersonii TaxID=4109 RepID=A0A9J6AWY7_SOLCO|nr:hypothetical protein H5410_000456 [Solanum commersonii]